jgi:Na+/pantothenate symporter
MFFPILLGLFLEKATPIAAYISIIVSSLVPLVYCALKKPFGILPIVPALFVRLIFMVVVSWITDKARKSHPSIPYSVSIGTLARPGNKERRELKGS